MTVPGGTADELRAQVRAVVAGLSPRARAEVNPGDRLVEDLGYDSLAVVELSAELESRFPVAAVDTDRAAAVTTVGDVENLVLGATGRTGPG